MKKAFLTILFTNYILFMPFVMVNCSMSDEPYNKLPGANGNEVEAEPTPEEIFAECKDREYLTADCVGVLQDDADAQAEEEATVNNAAQDTADLITCPDEIATVEDTTTTVTTDTSGSSGETTTTTPV